MTSSIAVVRTVFISYSWDSDDHKNWVRQLAERLTANGVHVHLDQWDVQFGDSLTQFMEEKIPESDFVLIICTPAYAKKSTQRQGGVGYEAQIVSAGIAASIPRSKFVPIIRSGGLNPSEPDCAIPPHFQRIMTVDMRQEAQYNTMFKNLLRHIYGQPAVKRPPLGSPPDFVAPAAGPRQAVRLASFAPSQPAPNPIKGSRKLTPAQARQFLAGDSYINVHTKNHPAGANRGQVKPELINQSQ